MTIEYRLAKFGRVVIYANEEEKLKRGKEGKYKPANWVLSGLTEAEAKIVRAAALERRLLKIAHASGRPPKPSKEK